MSGIEVIGLLAGAGQLIEYGLAFVAFVSATYDKIKDAPGVLEEHVLQIRDLLDVTKFVQKNSYDPVVYTHIQSIHSEAGKLVVVLDRDSKLYKKKSLKGYWLTVTGRDQKIITSIFDKLEKAKLALTLYLVSSNTGSLNSIQISLNNLENEMSQRATKTKKAKPTKESNGKNAGRGTAFITEPAKASAASPERAMVPHPATAIEAAVGSKPAGDLIPFENQNYEQQYEYGAYNQASTTPGPTNTMSADPVTSRHLMKGVKIANSKFFNGHNNEGNQPPPTPNASISEVDGIEACNQSQVFNGSHNSYSSRAPK